MADEERLASFQKVITLTSDMKEEDVKAALAGVERERKGFAFTVGDTLYMANSHENRDITEQVEAVWDGRTYSATLPVHSYLIVQKHEGGYRIAAEGRRDRVSRLRIEGVELAVTEKRGAVTAEHIEGGTELSFDHSEVKFCWVVIE